jgi:hypothetical protein
VVQKLPALRSRPSQSFLSDCPPLYLWIHLGLIMIGLAHNSHKKKTQHVDLGDAGEFTVHKGKLHEALGIPQDETIPASKKEPHSGDSPEMAAMRRSAKGFSKMKR